MEEVVRCGEEGVGRKIVAHNTEADLAGCLIAPVGSGGVMVGNVSKVSFGVRNPSRGVFFTKKELEEKAILKVIGPMVEEEIEKEGGESVPLVCVEGEGDEDFCTFEWVPPAEGSYFVQLVVEGVEIASAYLPAVCRSFSNILIISYFCSL